MSYSIRAAVLAATSVVLAACSSTPPTTTASVSRQSVPLPTKAPAAPRTTASVRPVAGGVVEVATVDQGDALPGVRQPPSPAIRAEPVNPGSLMGAGTAAAGADRAPGSLFGSDAADPEAQAEADPVVEEPAPPEPTVADIGGMELRGALPGVTEPTRQTASVTAAAAAAPAPAGSRLGASPPTATALRGSWRLRTTASNVSCSIAMAPADQRSAGSVSAQKECRAYGALNRFELRGRDLVLIDPFGETATLNPLGAFWQGKGKNGEGIILQR